MSVIVKPPPAAATDRSIVGPWPTGFTWGVSTSSYQIEGAVDVDGRGASIWDLHCRVPGRIANGDRGDIACDHYHRYPDDVALMRELGVKAYRFSIAWPRVLPSGRGAANEAGLAFYDRLIDALLVAGIEPWICLYHWDLPQSLEDLGGWQSSDSPGWFADYAALIARRYGDRVKRFATFNEPSVFALFGYALGWNAPGLSDALAYFRAVHHVNLAHGGAIDALRGLVPAASLGVIHNSQPCRPQDDSDEDRVAASILDVHWNRAFLDPQCLARYPDAIWKGVAGGYRSGDMSRICRPLDWIGINHYSPIYAAADKDSPLGFRWADPPAEAPRTPVGWHVDPAAFRDTLIMISRRYRLPIYVTENGAGAAEKPDADGRIVDTPRIDYLRAYIHAMHEAIAAGSDIRGYFVWSLLDNFEWGSGYANRFGLVYVDYPTQRRTPKMSAHWYAQLIARSGQLNPA